MIGSEFIKTLWFPWSFSTLWRLLTLSPIFMKVKMKRFNQITNFLHFYINSLIKVLTPKNPVVQFKLYDLQPDAGSPHVLFSSKTKLFSFCFSKYFQSNSGPSVLDVCWGSFLARQSVKKCFWINGPMAHLLFNWMGWVMKYKSFPLKSTDIWI